ncbi:MAG: SGNH/GDSL hydrolase family protein [Actinomycetota bacterium]|nr:SGNH/GDSL hydrolase family protein [Actinomycetota bacterium]
MIFRGIRRRAPKAAVAAFALAVCGLLTGCADLSAQGSEPGAAPSPTPIATPSAQAEAPSTSVVVVGDSLSAGDGFDAIPQDPGSWTMFLDKDLKVTGGWARNGATTTSMADNLELSRGDVLVVMGGTNDAVRSLPVDETRRSVERIVEKVYTDAVILCAIPPLSRDRDAATRINTELKELATEKGWLWLDPWELYRDGDDWTSGASLDGLHAGLPAYRSAGLVISEAIEQVTVTRVG